ncbi:hypothetical protein QBC47DRAFT_389735 [Echria macrotheca]|uniref:Uncharacterized protein n=1 Tax=Echria macrotheca TaxID=438768 RepID=A0AAJ0B807_9PEZI|nr:hypothetical protein QBC47DRAFT_389735 [Echria macrotheca]
MQPTHPSWRPLALALLSLSVSPSLAQSTSTKSLILPGIFETAIEASLVTASASTTTYVLTCPPSIPATKCVLEGGVSFTEAGSTSVHWEQTFSGDTIKADCTFSGDNAYFTVVNGEGDEMTTTGVQRNYKTLAVPVTITAGLDGVGAGQSAGPGSGSGSAGTPTATGTAATGTAASSSSRSAAGPRATGDVVFAGVVAALGAVML